MSTPADLEAICASLPRTEKGVSWGDRPTWRVVGGKRKSGFLLYRAPHGTAVDPATGDPYDDLVVIRVADAAAKAALVEGDGPFFTIAHFDRSDAVLLQLSRLGEVAREELVEVLTEAWATDAPRALVEEHLGAP